MRNSPNERHLLFLLALALVASSCASGPWRRTDDFVSHLRCRMSEHEVIAEASRFTKVRITRSARRNPELVVIKDQTQIVLGLEAGEVRDYQVNWVSSFMKRTHGLKRDLCSDRLFVELHILAPTSAAGSAVLLDTVLVGELSGLGALTLDVPLGKHHLTVENAGVGSWSTELHYDESSSGYDRVSVELNGAG